MSTQMVRPLPSLRDFMMFWLSIFNASCSFQVLGYLKSCSFVKTWGWSLSPPFGKYISSFTNQDYTLLWAEHLYTPLPHLRPPFVENYHQRSGFSLSPKKAVPEDQIDQYIQEAIDMVSVHSPAESNIMQTKTLRSNDQLNFIVGPTSTTQGALRASLGHPDPFNVRYVQVGNEDFLSSQSWVKKTYVISTRLLFLYFSDSRWIWSVSDTLIDGDTSLQHSYQCFLSSDLSPQRFHINQIFHRSHLAGISTAITRQRGMVSQCCQQNPCVSIFLNKLESMLMEDSRSLKRFSRPCKWLWR